MAWYRNSYECTECGEEWEDEWSCCCDDECPNCGSSDWSPVDSENLSVIVETDDEMTFSIYYSPADAGHCPDYVLLAETKIKNLALFLQKLAFQLSAPE
ncbi:putative nucleic acid-binding Zn-ribbon protein [Rhizobium aquaticum]|uniref:Nucleic acid-binding Zn-ribbon protein n=1 Tax=Rhizobium aquaticum TaxID=1549636 RepID=A0ABV2IUD4_9HYPH